MPETANLPNRETKEDQPETISTDSLKQRIADLSEELGLNLKHETLPRALTIGASKEIAGARIPELIKLLTNFEKDFEENTAVLKSAADAIDTTVEELLVDSAFSNMWTTRAWRRTQLDLIAELKSILNLYCEHLARLAAKKAKEDEETREVAKIPEIPTTYDGLVAAVKRNFLEKRTAEIEDCGKKTVAYVVWEDFFDNAKKIIDRRVRAMDKKDTKDVRLTILHMLAETDAAKNTFAITHDDRKRPTVLDSIEKMYIKAHFLAGLQLDRDQNEHFFWKAVSELRALETGREDVEPVTALRTAVYPGDKFDVPHKKRKWKETVTREIAEQEKLAASDSNFLDQVEAVLEFLTSVEHADTENQPPDHKAFLPFPVEFLLTIETVKSAQTIQAFKQKLSDVFNGNCSAGARVPVTSADWREIALNARTAALKAISDQWRARGSAKEAWAFGGREQRRRFAAEETLHDLRQRMKEATGIL